MLKSSLLYKILRGVQDMCFIWKTEMRNVFRDEGVLIFCILVPLGYPLLYSWIYNNEVVREVDTAIVDLSHSHTSREFIREYDATPDAKHLLLQQSGRGEATGTKTSRSRHSLYPVRFRHPSQPWRTGPCKCLYRHESDAYLQGHLPISSCCGEPHQFGHSDYAGWRLYGSRR